jgi:hypothetical protein
MPPSDTQPATGADSAAPIEPLFVAVGYDGLRMSSADSASWTNVQVGKEGEVYRAVCHGNGLYVAVGSYAGSNIFAASRDARTWESATKDAKYKSYIRSIGFGGGQFLGLGGDPGSVGSSAPIAVTSPDGVHWSNYTDIVGKNILRRVAFGTGDKGGLFVGVGDRGRRAASPDGLKWSDAPAAKAIDTLVDIAFGTPGDKGIFVGVGLHSLRMTTTDGVYWSKPVRGEEGEHLNSIVWCSDRKQFTATGPDVTYTSPDGWAWRRDPVQDGPLTMTYGVAKGVGTFVGNRWRGRIISSIDAIAWHETYKGEHHVEGLCFGG